MNAVSDRMLKHERRLRRQIEALAASVPWARGFIDWLLEGRTRWLRVPLGVLMIFGGFLGFLPILGFWMLPLGLLMLALDLPALRPVVSSAMIRLRRRLRGWWRRRA
jgi:hypothetical protein